MSDEAPLVVSAPPPPPTPELTPAMERANRLQALVSHPGFPDLVKISDDLVKIAVKHCTDYPGWDAQQIMALFFRMKAATEHHEALLAEIRKAILGGIEEGKSLMASGVIPVISAKDALDQADFVRTKVLEKFAEREAAEGRVAGSYDLVVDDKEPSFMDPSRVLPRKEEKPAAS